MLRLAAAVVVAVLAGGLAAATPGGNWGSIAADHQQRFPVVEVLWVAGCDDEDRPRGVTDGCQLSGAAATITIRGRGFGSFGARVLLVPAQASTPTSSPTTGLEGAAPTPSDASPAAAVVCDHTKHSDLLPHQLLVCALPNPLLRAGVKYHVKVVTREGVAGLLRNGGTMAPAAATGESDTAATKAAKTDQLLSNIDQPDWKALGIGGLSKQLKQLFRRAFATRLPSMRSISQTLQLPHVKGVILFGLPGTGKTLVARKVAQLLGAKQVKLVNGPEIMSKYVGDSEKNLRELFHDAAESFAALKERAPLHVIILDEMDAIMRQRGGAGSDDSAARAVYDGVTTQMLAYMDGVKSLNNILVIGLTNRLEAIDTALLRPGRFEVQIRLPLPDAVGRRQIFEIHTALLRKEGYLDNEEIETNLDQLASETTSLSGADIAGVVRSAVSFGVQRYTTESKRLADAVVRAQVDADPHADPTNTDAVAQPTFQVTLNDLRRGVREILSSRGPSTATQIYLESGFVLYNAHVMRVVQRLERLAKTFAASDQRWLRVALHGAPGTGTTATAALVARLVNPPFVHVISPDAFIGLSTSDKIERIRQVFLAASQTAEGFSCVIVDAVDQLLEYSGGSEGRGSANAALLNELSSLLRHHFVAGQDDENVDTTSAADVAHRPNVRFEHGRVIVILVSSSASGDIFRMIDTGGQLIDAAEQLFPLTRDEAAAVLTDYRVAQADVSNMLPERMPIKRLLYFADLARTRQYGEKKDTLRPRHDASGIAAVRADESQAQKMDSQNDADASPSRRAASAHQFVAPSQLAEVLEEFGALHHAHLLDGAATDKAEGSSF